MRQLGVAGRGAHEGLHVCGEEGRGAVAGGAGDGGAHSARRLWDRHHH